MKYDNITRAVFRRRPNRFIAEVNIGEREEIVHVKNTGRCHELLIPGCEVYLTAPGTPGRKTRYDLVAVRKSNGLLFNIDSQAPNKVVKEWLVGQGFDKIIPEYTYGDSRIDFYMERRFGTEETKEWQETKDTKKPYIKQPYIKREPGRYLMEVKGCTLEIDGIGYFPDAPTARGVKHIGELIKAKNEGYQAILAFVIQMDGITQVRPNISTHPEFGTALQKAKDAGVDILFLPCHVTPESLQIII